MKTQRDVIVRVNTLSVFKRGWEYNLFLAQDVRRDTAERWVNSAKRGKKKKEHFPLCLFPATDIIWRSLFLHLHRCLLLTLRTWTPLFRLFDWSQVASRLFNDWLTSYEEALHYFTVQQASETAARTAPVLRTWTFRIRSRWNQNGMFPCVAARFECMFSSVCVSKLSMVHAQAEFSRCLANVLCWWRTCAILDLIFICILKPFVMKVWA